MYIHISFYSADYNAILLFCFLYLLTIKQQHISKPNVPGNDNGIMCDIKFM